MKMKTVFLCLLFLSPLFAQPELPVDSYRLGMSAFYEKVYGEAFERFRTYQTGELLNDELFSSAAYFSAESFHRINQTEAAISGYEYFVNRFQFSAYRSKVLFDLGVLYYKQKEIIRCRNRMLTLLKDYPYNENRGTANYWIAQTLIEEARYDEAIPYLETAYEQKRTNKLQDFSVYALGYCYEQTGKYQKAVDTYDELLSYYKESKLVPAAQVGIGNCYFRLGQFEQSILELSSPELETMPEEKKAEALYLLANAYYRTSDFKNAETAYREIVRKYPDDLLIRDAKYALAWALFQQKQYADSYDIFEELSIDRDSIAVKSFFWKAEAKRFTGDESGALQIYQQFIKKYPNSPFAREAQFKSGIIYFQQGQYDQASGMMLKASTDPDVHIRGRAFTLLGEIALNKKEYGMARQYFGTALELPALEPDLRIRNTFGSAVASFYEDDFVTAQKNLEEIQLSNPDFESDKVNFYLAETYFAKGDYQLALKSYRAVKSKDDAFQASVLYGSAYCFFNTKDYPNASFNFSDFLKKYPNDERADDARLRIGDAYFADKNFAAAINAYSEILNRKKRFENRDYIQYQYALALYYGGRSPEAVSTLQKLIDSEKGSKYIDNARFLIGWIYFKETDYRTAIEKYRIVLRTASNQKMIPLTYYSIGDCYFNMEEYDSAIVNYSTILEKYPKSEFAYDAVNGIQYSYFATGSIEDAIQVIDDYIKKNPSASFADKLVMKRGELYYSSGDYKEAQLAYSDFIKRYPSSGYKADAYYWLGKSFQNQGKEDDAIAQFQNCYKNFPGTEVSVSSVIDAGKIYAGRKQYDNALAVFEAGLGFAKGTPHAAELLFLKAQTLQRKGDNASAYDSYQQIVGQFPSNVFADKARLELGILELESRRYENAQAFFDELIKKRTDDIAAAAQYYSGMIQFNQSNYDAAIKLFQKVLKVYLSYEDWQAKAMLRLGDSYEKKGDIDKAKDMYRSVFEDHGGDELGKEAKAKLEKLK